MENRNSPILVNIIMKCLELTDIEIPVKMSLSISQFKLFKIRFDVSYLNVCFICIQLCWVDSIGIFYYYNIIWSKSLCIEVLKKKILLYRVPWKECDKIWTHITRFWSPEGLVQKIRGNVRKLVKFEGSRNSAPINRLISNFTVVSLFSTAFV